MKKYLLPVLLAFSVLAHSEETPSRVPSTPVTISSTSFTTFSSATLQPFTYSERLLHTETPIGNLPLSYVGLASNGSVKMGFTHNLSTAASFEETVASTPSDSLSISTLANVSTNDDRSLNHSAMTAWRDVATNKIHYAKAKIAENAITLDPTSSLESSTNVLANSLKLTSVQGLSGPSYTLLWIETTSTNINSLKYAVLSGTDSSEKSVVNTAISFTSTEPLTYVTAEDCDGGLHVLAYNSQRGLYYLNKPAGSDTMSSGVKILSKAKASSIHSFAIAGGKQGFASIVVTYKNNNGNFILATLHKYPSQTTPVEQDKQPIAALLEGKTIKHTIDPESNETTTVFIANKDNGKPAIHLYTRKTVTIAPKDEMVSLPLKANPDSVDVDILISHIDGTKEDIVGITSGSTIPAYISMRTIKYDFFSKFRQILPIENTSSTTHLSLEAVAGGVVISYLDATGTLAVSTISVPMEQDLTH